MAEAINSVEEEKEKEMALKVFSMLSPEKLAEARALFLADCRHHNPYIAPGMDALLEEIKQAQNRDDMPKDGIFSIKHVLADGEKQSN